MAGAVAAVPFGVVALSAAAVVALARVRDPVLSAVPFVLRVRSAPVAPGAGSIFVASALHRGGGRCARPRSGACSTSCRESAGAQRSGKDSVSAAPVSASWRSEEWPGAFCDEWHLATKMFDLCEC